eukprot:1889243-Rhodomonas_salina.1
MQNLGREESFDGEDAGGGGESLERDVHVGGGEVDGLEKAWALDRIGLGETKKKTRVSKRKRWRSAGRRIDF